MRPAVDLALAGAPLRPHVIAYVMGCIVGTAMLPVSPVGPHGVQFTGNIWSRIDVEDARDFSLWESR